MPLDQDLAALGAALARWSAAVARAGAKDDLAVPGLGVSAWWFSLFSERNPLKTEAFLKLARRDFTPPRGGWWLLRGLKLWLTLAWRGVRARRALAAAPRPALEGWTLAFVTYFPALDENALSRGVFRDRYFGPLQDALTEAKRPTLWLLHYVALEGRDYGEALALARRLADAGEAVYFLEEFLTPGDALRGIFQWLSVAFRAARLYGRLDRALLFAPELGGEAAEPIIDGLWRRSFFGPPCVEGIAYGLMLRRLLARLPERGDLVYLSERQAWEKGLEAAKKAVRPNWRTIGYQHSALLRNWWSYFHGDDEAALGLPLPDVLAVNGALPMKLLSQTRYPAVARVEALRYLPLKAALQSPVPEPLPRALLVAGSVDPHEAAALAALVAAAFPRGGDWSIRFKGHPMTPFSVEGYEIAKGSLAVEIERSGVVLAAASGAALEALAYGREVVIARFDALMPMSPLQDAPETARWVSSPNELRAAAEAAVSAPVAAARKRAFVESYWDLDAALPRWRALLGLPA